MNYDPSKDYYKILGISSSASSEEIRIAHKKLALKYHPDTSTDASLSSIAKMSKDAISTKFVEITEAWTVLSKRDTKSQYDTARNKAKSNASSLSDANFGSTPATSVSTIPRHVGSNNARTNTSKDWRDFENKYRTEAWKKLSIEEQKRFRRMPVTSINNLVVPVMRHAAIWGGLVFVVYKLSGF